VAVTDGLCQILREDPDLAAGVPERDREAALHECTAKVLMMPAGPWNGAQADELEGGIGLLVLEGCLLRRVGVEGRFGAELLGDGDLLRPWQEAQAGSQLPRTTGWRVLEPTRIAVLDEAAAQRCARYPGLTGCFVARAIDRSRMLTVNLAIVHQTRIDVRLHMLLWHLAGRWGRVRSDGVLLPLRLTHSVLAELVAARRPTVTTAVAELTRRGALRSVGDAWLLGGPPPGELLELDRT
jgi:CRP-like cAMP-binding protein